MNSNPIGIIDSGVGGLSIWQELVKLLPHEDTIYLADQKNLPYGTKTEKELIRLVSLNVGILTKLNVKLIVIACNTATVYTLAHLRQRFSLPIVGTVPVIKKAAKETKNGRIGVISTLATQKSDYEKNLIASFAAGFQVYTIALDQAVSLIENLKLLETDILPLLENNLAYFKEKNIDVLALGCTHYSFIKNHLQKFFGKKVKIFEPAGAIARHVKRVLEDNSALERVKKAHYFFYTTGERKEFEKQLATLINLKTKVYKA